MLPLVWFGIKVKEFCVEYIFSRSFLVFHLLSTWTYFIDLFCWLFDVDNVLLTFLSIILCQSFYVDHFCWPFLSIIFCRPFIRTFFTLLHFSDFSSKFPCEFFSVDFREWLPAGPRSSNPVKNRRWRHQ